MTCKTPPKANRKKILVLYFKLGFAAPPVQSESLQIAAAWLCVNAGEELHRNHNKRWKGCSQSGFFSLAFNFPAVRFFFFSLLKPIEAPVTEHSIAAVKQYLICTTAEEILDCSTKEALQIVWSCLLHILLSFSRSFRAQEIEDPSLLQISAFATLLQTHQPRERCLCFPL